MMAQPFIFGEPEITHEPVVVYVNKEPLSQTLHRRLCSNPDEAIILFDKHNDENTKLQSIYNGYDLKTYGLSTMFEQDPSLAECQHIWKQELDVLRQQCITNCSVIIIESNPDHKQSQIKHALARLLPINYRLDLQQKLDEFQSQINSLSNSDNSPISDKVRTATKLSDESDIDQNETKQEELNASGANLNEDLCETEEEEIGSLVVFSNFMSKSMKTMRQFVQIGQFIETLCLGISITKYLFLCKKTRSVLILFENESDSELVMRQLNGMKIDNVSISLVVQYANVELSNKVTEMFHDIDQKKLQYAKEQRMKRLQQMQEEKKESEVVGEPIKEQINKSENHNNNNNKNHEIETKHVQKHGIQSSINNNNRKIETVVSETFVFGQKHETIIKEKDVQKPVINDIKSPEIKPFAFEIKYENEHCVKRMHETKKLRACTELNVCLLRILGAASSINNEMIFDIDKDKILSSCSEHTMGKYIKNMIVSQQLNVWQYKDYKKAQWKDVDMMLSIYLNILPLNEKVSIIRNKSELQFELIRTSELNGVLRYFINKNIAREYKLNRITKSMQSGVYIPVFWEREMMNRSMNKTYLYTIDLDVFIYFGESLTNKYPSVWYKYLKQHAMNGAIESVISIQNWIQYHSFHFYSNWKIAAHKSGYKTVYLWFIQNSKKTDINVIKNGFYSSQIDTEWMFYRDIESAMKANRERNDILLCEVCIDEKQEKQLMDTANAPYCKRKNSLCGLPQLCIRFRK